MNSFKQATTYLARFVGVIVLVTLTIIAGIVIWKYILPKYQEIQATRAEIDTLQTKRTQLTSYVAYLHELETTTLPFEEELVNYAIPSENDVISLIVTYEGLAKTPDVKVSAFDLAPGLIQSDNPTTNDAVAIRAGEPVAASDDEANGTQSQELEFSMEVKTEKPETALDFITKIHQTRRIFTIKQLSWSNPEEGQTENDNIILTLNLGTHYYPSTPQIVGSEALVNKGKQQGDFIARLNSSTVYDALVLDAVEVGKEDLFTLESNNITPTPQPNPTPIQTLETTPTTTVIQPVTF